MPHEVALPPPFRPLPIAAMNAVGRGMDRLGSKPISLDEGNLLRAASRMNGGLTDFGGNTFRPGFRKLLESLEADAKLTLFGRYFARRQMLELLTQRLVLTAYRKQHPDVASLQVRQPIFILGLPRTGTTLLYGLLSQDPAHRTPLSWEVDDPVPPAETDTYDTDPRIAKTEKRFEQLRQLAPGFQTVHPIGSLMPQECIVITAPEFMSVRFEMCFDVASYQSWLLDQDMTDTYRFHKCYLQHMQSRHAKQRWVVKSPGHLGPIDAIFAVYPDACLVQTHRDPIRIVPSVASLEYHMRVVATDDLDPLELGRQQLHLWATLLDQGMAARDRHPEREQRIVDLRMSEIVSDPIGCVRRVYDRFGFGLTSLAESRMRAYLEQHPRNEFGTHRYSLASFGLDESEVNERYKGYRERFGVEAEPY